MVKENDDEIIDIVTILLKRLDVKVTNSSIKKHVELQSNSNSLLNVSNVLTKWKVANAAYYVATQDIHLVPCPFLAKTSFRDARFVVVSHVGEAGIKFCGRNRKVFTYTLPQFSERYEGIVLAADADEASGEPNYRYKRRVELIGKIRLPVFFFTAVFCLATALLFFSPLLSTLSWRIGLITISKSLGLFTTILLVLQSAGKESKLARKLCHSGNVNCSSVIESAGAKTLWGSVSWSELGLLYYSSTLLLVIFWANFPAVLHFLSVAGMICLPYTFYSIYYQAAVIKKWCLLCCFIQLLFWLEAALLLPLLSGPIPTYTVREWASIGFCIGLPLACWSFFRPFLFKSNEADNFRGIVSKFLYNDMLFGKILQEQPRHSLPEDKYSIILGNSNAENNITVVINPFCTHCAEIFSEIDETFEKSANFKLTILFATNAKSDAQEISLIKDILSINNTDNANVSGAIRSWFNSRNYSRWARVYGTQAHEQIIEDIVKGQRDWCKRENIVTTPTILVNGYELPDVYSIQSLPELLN